MEGDIISHPVWFHQIHFISLLQIKDYAEAPIAIFSIIGDHDELTIFDEVCSRAVAKIEEAGTELVGSISRGDEFPIIGAVDIVNVTASDVGDDLVELDDFPLPKCFVVRQTDCEIHT